jgi:hypothetical protein
MAEDKSTKVYTVTVTVLPKPTPEPDPIPVLPKIESYTLNGVQNNLVINPKINNVTINLVANKNVEWKSITIINEQDSTLDKSFRQGEGCLDGTNTCTKIWDGTFPGDRILLNGNYKIRVHIVDSSLNDYEQYLPSVITVTGQSM